MQNVSRLLRASIILSILLCSYLPLQAQSSLDLLSPEVKGEIKNSLGNSLNALVIFSSSSSLGSGQFGFRDDAGPDDKLEVIRAVGQYDFLDPEQSSVAPFVKGGIGKTKLTESIPDILEMGGRDDFSTVTTWSYLVGIGIDLEVFEDFRFVPYFDFVYSNSKNKYDYNNQFSQEVLSLFEPDIVNWNVDTASYNPGALLYYTARFDRISVKPSINYTQVYLDSLRSNSDLLNLTDCSGVLQSKVEVELPVTEGSGKAGAYLVPSISRTDLYGDASRGLDLNYYHEVGLAFLEKEHAILPYLSEVGISVGYAFGDSMWGWRIGLQGAL